MLKVLSFVLLFAANAFGQAWPYVPTTMETKMVVDANTLALYHMDDASGTTITDATGTYPGALHGGSSWIGADGGNVGNVWPTPIHGATGDCVIFDGTNGYMDVSGLLDNPPAAFSVEGWFKTTGVPPANSRLFAKYVDNSPYNGFDCKIDNRIRIGYIANGVTTTLTSTLYDDTIWNHFALTYNGTTLSLYLDGILVDHATASPFTSHAHASTFSFGNLTQPGFAPCCYTHVTMDEIRVSSKCRSRNEVQQSYWRRRAAQPDGSTEYEKLVKHGAILTANGGWEGTTSVAEPAPYYVGGVTFEGVANVQWVMSYSGNLFGSVGVGIAYTTDITGLTGWTRSTHNPIVGADGSGAARSKLVYYNSTYYMFYAVGGNIKLITTTGNGTYSSAATVLASGVTLVNLQNTGILPPRSTGRPWQMWVEGNGSALGNYVWAIGYATCSNANPATGFTPQGGLITSLLLGPSGTASAPDVRDINGVYFMHYSGANRNSVLPTYGYAAVSLDSGLTWTREQGTVIDIDEKTVLAGQDQVSGLKSRDNDGSTVLVLYDIDNNTGGGSCVICAATYGGSLECLIDCFRCVNAFNFKSWP